MRVSNLFTKTSKTAPGDEVAKNAQLLIRAGFIYKEMAVFLGITVSNVGVKINLIKKQLLVQSKKISDHGV